MADFSAFRLSAGLSLLSMPMTSNLTPAGFLALNFSAKNWKLLSWFWRVDPGDLDGLALLGHHQAGLQRQRGGDRQTEQASRESHWVSPVTELNCSKVAEVSASGR